MKSGFVTLVGRPNVGKSTVLNSLCHKKVSIVSDKPQTTRHAVRGVVNRPDTQIVFVDTPGLHKPVTALGRRVNAAAIESLDGIDVACLVIDATAPFGRGDQWVAERLPAGFVVIVNKIDRVKPVELVAQLTAASSLPASAFFPVSGKTGEGIEVLVDHLASLMPDGPQYYPDDVISDQPDEQWVAELVREQLLGVTHDELPYSIATRVTDWEGNRIRVEILVERESQKGMVIGKNGEILKQAGERARRHLPPKTYLDLVVRVEKDWQRRQDSVERLY